MKTIILQDGKRMAWVDFLLMHHSRTQRETAVIDALKLWCPRDYSYTRTSSDAIKRTQVFRIKQLTPEQAMKCVNGLCYEFEHKETKGTDFSYGYNELFTTDYYWLGSGNLIRNNITLGDSFTINPNPEPVRIVA